MHTWTQSSLPNSPPVVQAEYGHGFYWAGLGAGGEWPSLAVLTIAAYAPSRSLRHIKSPDLTKRISAAKEMSLAFEDSIQNEAVQGWLLSLFSRKTLAGERGVSADRYARVLERVQAALGEIYGEDVCLDVDVEHFQLFLRVRGKRLNFSQLPDGIRNTVGWLADFLMRRDVSIEAETDELPGILLLDEVDAHLHPSWQRTILPALKAALPDVQIITASHSPFVISSCPGARVHLFEADERGVARAKGAYDAPVGESVTATLKDIFGVSSRFDVGSERDLGEWNELEKRAEAGRLSGRDKKRHQELTAILSERSGELRSIVTPPPKISPTILRSLSGASRTAAKTQKKRRSGSR